MPFAHAPGAAAKVLVIGGSRGIGKAVVTRLAAIGARCAIGYASDDSAATATAGEVSRIGARPTLVRGDIANDGGRMVVAAIEQLDGLDGIVVTAVPKIIRRVLAVTRDELQMAMDSQVWGLLEVARSASDSLARSSGSIVAVSSVGASRYARYYGALGPAKAALDTTIRYLAAELGPRGVRVNGVAPSLVVNPEDPGAEITGKAEILEQVRARTPLRRLASPADIAGVVAALLSADFRFVTGQVITVDGGYGLLA